MADTILTQTFVILFFMGIGLASGRFGCLKEEMMKSFRNKLGALLLKPAMRGLKHKLDPSAVGGTPLLGINGAVVKAHGNSKGEAFANAIEQCIQYLSSNVNAEIAECMARSKQRAREEQKSE